MPSEADYGGTGEPEIVDESRTAKGNSRTARYTCRRSEWRKGSTIREPLGTHIDDVTRDAFRGIVGREQQVV